MYKLDNHRYPTTNQGLESLVEAPTLPPLAANYNKEGYIKRLPADPQAMIMSSLITVNMVHTICFQQDPMVKWEPRTDITNWGLSKKKKSAMNQQRGFTLLEMMLVLALVAITASVVLFTYGREDAASTRARETAARFTAAQISHRPRHAQWSACRYPFL